MELDTRKLEQVQKQYQQWLKAIPGDVYSYDNCICCCFADTLSEAAKKDGFTPWKVCALGSKRDTAQLDQSFNLQKQENLLSQQVNVPLFNQNKQQFEVVGWDYHMAMSLEIPCYKDSRKTATIVFDPVLFGDKIVGLEQWQKSLACPDYLLRRAMDGYSLNGRGTGYWLDDDPVDKQGKSKREIKKLCNEVASGELPQYRPLISQLSRSIQRPKVNQLPLARQAVRS